MKGECNEDIDIMDLQEDSIWKGYEVKCISYENRSQVDRGDPLNEYRSPHQMQQRSHPGIEVVLNRAG